MLLDRPDPKKADDRYPEGTGMTIRRNGVTGFPTIFVIDHKGTMVGPVWFSEHDRLSLVREK